MPDANYIAFHLPQVVDDLLKTGDDQKIQSFYNDLNRAMEKMDIAYSLKLDRITPEEQEAFTQCTQEICDAANEHIRNQKNSL